MSEHSEMSRQAISDDRGQLSSCITSQSGKVYESKLLEFSMDVLYVVKLELIERLGYAQHCAYYHLKSKQYKA